MINIKLKASTLPEWAEDEGPFSSFLFFYCSCLDKKIVVLPEREVDYPGCTCHTCLSLQWFGHLLL